MDRMLASIKPVFGDDGDVKGKSLATVLLDREFLLKLDQAKQGKYEDRWPGDVSDQRSHASLPIGFLIEEGQARLHGASHERGGMDMR